MVVDIGYDYYYIIWFHSLLIIISFFFPFFICLDERRVSCLVDSLFFFVIFGWKRIIITSILPYPLFGCIRNYQTNIQQTLLQNQYSLNEFIILNHTPPPP